MGARIGVTARRIKLGIELRGLRKAAGSMSLAEASKGLGFSESHLQRVEKGEVPFKQTSHLRNLLRRYGVVEDTYVETLLRANRESGSQDWGYSTTPPSMRQYVGIESLARSIRGFHPSLVLGLVQTERYARAVFETIKGPDEQTSEFVEQGVALRMQRQELITRDDSPASLWVILEEAALRNCLGDQDVMLEQYDAIIKLAQLEHITVQVRPTMRFGFRFWADFTILDLLEGLPSTVQVDNAWGAVSMSDKPREVGRFARKFTALQASAMAPEDTPRFLQQLSREIKETNA
ncbi:helix-turn-helix domain-containing protein [Streptomyces luteireticuli]|uniref:helix-turn-helix domain-containing protein n=1 Tax=Streptomyces luteireticuli TaxID=173858 RepID=UPI0035591F05